MELRYISRLCLDTIFLQLLRYNKVSGKKKSYQGITVFHFSAQLLYKSTLCLSREPREAKSVSYLNTDERSRGQGFEKKYCLN